MNTSIPAPASHIVELKTILEPLTLGKLFPRSAPLHVELGSGDGSFFVKYATLHPEWNFLGVERLLGRLRKIDRKGWRAGVVNVRLIRIEASYFLDYLLPKKSAAALHVYFPDPWPKRKHRKNRLVNEHFVRLTESVLVPGGTVFLRTDDADYFAQMKAVFGASKAFTEVHTPQPLAEVLTDFERGFLLRGVTTNHAAYQLAAS